MFVIINMPKIKTKTEDPQRVRLMYRAALEEKMKRWNCQHRNKNKQVQCRQLLLLIIKVIYAFPIYRKLYPNATIKELDIIWKQNSKEPSESSRSSTSFKSDPGSPRGLEFRCPLCESTDVVHQGFAGAIVVCTRCGHTWLLIGGDRFGPDLGENAYNRWKLPSITEYVDKKGRVVETGFPKIYPKDARPADEQYFQKIVEEFVQTFAEFKKEWEIGKYNRLLQITASILGEYMKSLPDGKGLPKKYKRASLLAVITYYASILTATGLEYEQLAEIFGVLQSDMDAIKDNEIEIFWTTKQGAKIFADLLPLLSAKKIIYTEESPTDSQVSIETSTFNSLKGIRGITKLGVKAFIMKLRDEDVKTLATESIPNKKIKIEMQKVENYFDDYPSELDLLLSNI